MRANTPYGYVGNAGWLDFAPAAPRVAAGDRHLKGSAYATNFGWIDLGDSTPADGEAYSNASPGDFGVNHDGRSEPYGADIGWINFQAASP